VGAGGGGKDTVFIKQDDNPFIAKMQLFFCRLSASQTSEHFKPKPKDEAFCIYIPKSVVKLKSALF
jgi:hypothetical protein